MVNATGTTLVSGSTSYQPSTFTGTVARVRHDARLRDRERRDVHRRRRQEATGASSCSARRSSQNLFAGADPVGQSVRVNGTQFQVVGVTEPKGSNGIQDQDDVVLAPLTAVQDALTRLRERAELDHGRGRSAATRSTPRRPR